MIRQLREKEEVMLYVNVLKIEETEAKEMGAYLQEQYHLEAVGFPYTVPPFDESAALWAAKTVYIACQLMLYREHMEEDLPSLLPDYAGKITPSTVLSADLCLRFLPDIIKNLRDIDVEDVLINVLEPLLIRWHYSGVRYNLPIEQLDISWVTQNDGLLQLYVDRIIAVKKIALAQKPVFKEHIKANLGIFVDDYWYEFKNILALDE
ncbi:MAG: hypothetical protein K1X55_13585 [Chitinophagales bacterium]|nr:hypothetical protein [Chitinophagales bacterium]